jgi:tRNA dimethylallyltransferase
MLIDVADHKENYNAAQWREDAIHCIQTLLGRHNQEQQESVATTSEASPSRRAHIQECIQQARIDKGYDCDNNAEGNETILPVVCGGTMMYLQWLVHGRPDAMRPTPTAVEISHKTIQEFQESNNDYDGAVQHVAAFGKVFAQRAQNLTSGDWYRLRRTLEIALTVEEMQKENAQGGEKSKADGTGDNLVEQLYSGEREGSLASLGFDVRCFFLCPDDRMSHTRVIDKRCEQMLMRGLLKETTELSLLGRLPEMAERAIGYRQTLDYLKQENTEEEKENPDESTIRAKEEEAFEFYLNDFTTATRRYAKKQMAWFRKDKDFMFIPVSLKLDKSDRVNVAANDINRLCKLSRADYESELLGGDDYVSGKTKRQNEEQGKTMKFYKPERHILTSGSKEYEDVLTEAIGCRCSFRSSNDTRKRTREDTPSPTRKK